MKIRPAVFKLWAVFLFKKYENSTNVTKISVLLRFHRNTYSHKVTSLSDQ